MVIRVCYFLEVIDVGSPLFLYFAEDLAENLDCFIGVDLLVDITIVLIIFRCIITHDLFACLYLNSLLFVLSEI